MKILDMFSLMKSEKKFLSGNLVMLKRYNLFKKLCKEIEYEPTKEDIFCAGYMISGNVSLKEQALSLERLYEKLDRKGDIL